MSVVPTEHFVLSVSLTKLLFQQLKTKKQKKILIDFWKREKKEIVVEKQMFYGWAYVSATMYLPLTLTIRIFGMKFSGGEHKCVLGKCAYILVQSVAWKYEKQTSMMSDEKF